MALADENWLIRESDLPPDPDVRGTLFCVGNGVSCTRGTLPEEGLGAFRGHYISGLYTFAGYGLIYLLGAPDWLPARVRTARGEPLEIERSDRILDLRAGVLRREATLRLGDNRFELVEERFASLARPELLAQRIAVRRLNGCGVAELVMGLDGDVRNHRAKYYKVGELPNVDAHGVRLSEVVTRAAADDWLHVALRSPQADRDAAVVARVTQAAGPAGAAATTVADGRAQRTFALPADSAVCVFEKLCVWAADVDGRDGRDLTIAAARDSLAELDFECARRESATAWEAFWRHADVRIEGDPRTERAVRYALWSTRIAAPVNAGAGSLGAKNLSGDWYRGGVFWDMEIFQLPMLSAVAPELVRNHLLYRARRLGAARRLAAQDGHAGARFPFTSYETGIEDPPMLHGAAGMHQLHVNLAVAWGVLHDHALTHDRAGLLEYGLEMLVENARFWASRAVRDAQGRYHWKHLRGPDELHGRIDDNAYTNVMAAWVLEQTDALIARLAGEEPAAVAHILARCRATEHDRVRWREIAAHVYVPRLADSEVMAQFEGFEAYPEPDERLTADQGEGRDRTHKQADTLLLFQNLPDRFTRAELEQAYRAYAPLCHQTSSLSLCTHAILAARLGYERDARRYFDATVGVDLEDTLGNTAHGIHGAGQGGIWLAVVHGFGGLRVLPDELAIEPALPAAWRALDYTVLFRRQPLTVRVEPEQVTVRNTGRQAVTVRICGESTSLAPGAACRRLHRHTWRPAELQAVIFDLDGVLVSTDRFHYLAWKALADELGLAFDEQVNHRLRGVSREGSLKVIYEHNRRPLPDAAAFAAQCAAKNERYAGYVAGMTPDDVLAGGRELLLALRAAGLRVGIASASRNTPQVLARTGLDRLVDAVADGNCISQAKPDPQVFYVAAQRLRCLPWACVGVEDAAAGLESIQRAGMTAVAVGEAVRRAPAALWVPDVTALDLARLREVFARAENPVDPYHERNIAKMRHELATG